MPEEGVTLSPPAKILTTSEIIHLSQLFVREGVTKIKLIGGEPTVRKDTIELMEQIGRLEGLRELCITTNGVALYNKLERMVDAGLTGVNVSLDSEDPFQYALMTRSSPETFARVKKTIDKILRMNEAGAGIELKINCVVIHGLNDKEITSFVEMTRHQDIEVQFTEYMPFDRNKWSSKKMLPYTDMLVQIRERYCVKRLRNDCMTQAKPFKFRDFEAD